ncbi:MAG: hypothetical protein ACRDYA_02110 [Egibacteraceae bacterium]
MVEHKALDVYLNDHLAGATGGCELALRCQADYEGTPQGEVFAELATEIEEDRQTLEALMERLGTAKNPIKQAATLLMEKLSRVKLGGSSSAETDPSRLLMLETLYLGVEGKACLWRSLKQVAGNYTAMASTDFDTLIKRAETQKGRLEQERMAAATTALAKAGSV